MNPNLQVQTPINPIHSLSVRLLVEEHPVGSGFVVIEPSQQYGYVLTAHHCFDDFTTCTQVTVEWYDYAKLSFIPLTVSLDECPLLAYTKEEPDQSFDGAILVIPLHKFPVLLSSIPNLHSIDQGKSCRFTGFPDALSNKEPEAYSGQVGVVFGSAFRFNVYDQLEDNTSTAYANVKGVSGSGLVYSVDDQLYLAGIITDFQVNFKRFVAQSLLGFNLLLSKHNLPQLDLLDKPSPALIPGPTDSIDFIDQCRKLLDEAEQSWEDLRPTQGLNLIRIVRKNLDHALVSPERRDMILARVNFLEACCAGDLREEVDHDQLFISAFTHAPDVLAYQERVLQAYLNKNEPQKAYDLAEKMLAKYPYNPNAWLIMALLEPTEAIQEAIRAEPAFKVGYLINKGKQNGDGTIRVADFLDLFRTEIDNRAIPASIRRKQIYYWSYVAQFAFHELKGDIKPITVERPRDLVGNPQLQYAADLLGRICERIELSELRNQTFFQVVRFEYCLCQYYLTGDNSVARQMAEQLYDLFIGDKQAAKLPFSPNRPPAINALPHRILELLQILAQQQEGLKMLDVITAAVGTIFEQHPFLHYFKGIAYTLLKDSPKQVESLRAFLKTITHIEELDAVNFIGPIQILLSKNEPIDSIYQDALVGKTFELPVLKPLLEAFLWSASKDSTDRAIASADLVHSQWSDLSDPLKRLLAHIYFRLQQWRVARELLAQLCTENEESDELLHYIIAVHEEGEDMTRFLSLAEKWRNNFTPLLGLIQFELDIHRQLLNWPKLEEVARYGLTHFPNELLIWFDLVSAMLAQGDLKKEALLAELAIDARVFHEEFSVAGQFKMAHICFTAGLPQKGLELAYRALKTNPENPDIEQAYFSLSANYQAFDNLEVPEFVGPDTVIKLRVDKKEDFLEINEAKIQNHPVASAANGKRVGDTFSVKDTLTLHTDQFEIIQILDKYSGQLAIIGKKAEHPLSGLPMKVFNIATDEHGNYDFDQFHKQLQDLFGAEGLQRKMNVERVCQQFSDGEIGFTELCLNVFRGDPIAAWQYATSEGANGFPIRPIYIQSVVSSDEETEYVLDFTSLLCLFFLDKEKPIPFKPKPFIISQFIIDYLTEELTSARQKRGASFTEDIQVDRVTVYVHPEDEQERKYLFYQELLSWIQQYCQADYAPERLSHSFGGKDSDHKLFDEQTAYASSMLDSILLTNRPNRILVTDDLLPARLEGGGHAVITTEYFLKLEYQELQTEHLWLEQIGLNYRGLTLGANQLYQVFKRSLLDQSQQKIYLKTTYSFSKQYNPAPQLLIAILLFLKQLYRDDFTINYKRQASQSLLRRYFSGTSLTDYGFEFLKMLIDKEFKLMGNLGEYVKKDFKIVLGFV